LHPNEQTIQKFYEAFHARDAAGMNSCYAPNIVFSDPAFGVLAGEKVFAMWQMLCGRTKELEITFNDIHADDKSGTAHWDAKYFFGPNHRPVHNIVDAAFVFRDGRIVEHTDTFDMWKWTRMAIGGIGIFFGWSFALRSAIQKSTRRQLDDFMQNKSAS
jgi:ketosteroid isomerase-like protein